MIFYFSGTGNSKWVAKEIAKKLDDTAVNIIKLNNIPDINNEKYIGFIFPIYAWSVPEPIINFVKKLPKTDAFVYGICTCGQDTGKAMTQLDNVYKLNSAYSITMTSNYIIASDVESEDKIKRKITEAYEKIGLIADEVKNNVSNYSVHEGVLPIIKTKVISKGFNKFARSTKAFFADDKCISCGKCARECPSEAIHFENGKPVWQGDCYMCLHCIHYCPKEAIQYGNKTKNRKRYNIEKYL